MKTGFKVIEAMTQNPIKIGANATLRNAANLMKEMHVGSLLVEHNKTGLTVPTKNAQLLADAVLDLIDNPHRRLLMGKLGKEKISTFFSADEFIRQHQNFYKKVFQAK